MTKVHILTLIIILKNKIMISIRIKEIKKIQRIRKNIKIACMIKLDPLMLLNHHLQNHEMFLLSSLLVQIRYHNLNYN